MGKKNTIETILSKINVVDSGCWEWTGYVPSQLGYGHVSMNSKPHRVHRVIYEYYHGEIDQKLVLDHLCRNKKCCNPIHLEQVTQRENVLRGVGIAALCAKQTHCLRGHEFNEDNTYITPNGSRKCRLCKRLRNLGYLGLITL